MSGSLLESAALALLAYVEGRIRREAGLVGPLPKPHRRALLLEVCGCIANAVEAAREGRIAEGAQDAALARCLSTVQGDLVRLGLPAEQVRKVLDILKTALGGAVAVAPALLGREGASP